MTVNDSAQASDGFGVVSTPVAPKPIQPAEPTRRRPSGRVDFPGGVVLSPVPFGNNHPIHINGLGWLTIGMAKQVAASLAGAVAEAERQAAQEAELRP